MGELFKMKMVTEAIVHDCIVNLLKKKRQDCLCVLLSTTGKHLDTVKSKVCVRVCAHTLHSSGCVRRLASIQYQLPEKLWV